MDRDLADFWNLLWELGLAGCALFALLNAFAPHQDLPWKPLDLRQPIGQATAAKVSDFELSRTASAEEVEAVTEACLAMLREAGVQAVRADDRDNGGFCVVRGAVRLTGGDVTPLSPGGLVMQCPLAMRYVIWDRQVLRPAARETFGVAPAAVDNFGSYACRRIYNSKRPGDRPSEHARANALDVSGVVLADGRQVDLTRDWNGRGPAGEEGRTFLKRLRGGACRVFATVLSPDYNAEHRDHLHLDGAPRGLCA